MKWLYMTLFAAIAACGGGGASAERTLPTGEARASQEQCVAAVNNYEHIEFSLLPYPVRVQAAAHDVAYQQTREQRLRMCSSDMSAAQADCMSKAQSLPAANACAPNQRW